MRYKKKLDLGLTKEIIKDIKKKRSNIKSVELGDITKTKLYSDLFDVAVSVEVIEHVPDDSAFVYQIHRILKSRGVLVLTTPNGEARENTNPDHIREYSKAQLEAKLKECFDDVSVFYGAKKGFLHDIGLTG